MTLLLSIICGILFVALVASVYFNVKLYKAGVEQMQIAESYEQFYEHSIEIVDGFYENVDTLMTNRQMISDDPDVQGVYRTIGVLHDFLLDYLNVRNPGKGKEKA